MRHLLVLLAALGATAAVADPPAVITTAAGTGTAGYAGDGGPATKAALNNPFDVAFDAAGNLYLSDTFNHRIRRVDAKTGVITTVAGAGAKGFSGDGGPATQAEMNEPYGIVLDRAGNLYFADRLNRRVRRVDAKTGVITTLAGDGSKAYSGDGGPAARAGLAEPNGVALDPAGLRLYIADVADHRVRVVDLATGTISTFAGNGKGRHEGDGGPSPAAAIFGARAVEVGPDGTVHILERGGNTLRAVDPKTGTISTVAGTGAKGNTGDGGPARAATFNGPKELAVDPSGNILIVDTENHSIRRIDARTGTVTTLAGNGQRGGSGDGGPAASAQLSRPHGVAVGPDGAVYVGDTENHRVRKVSP
jgi:DNA-binding beta-propeller fold protein YncE